MSKITTENVLKDLTHTIIGAAIEVHQELGPELLESDYETCLSYLLVERGLKVDKQKPIPVQFRGISLDCGYRLDLIVNEQVIVEIKAVETISPVHRAQLFSYLKLTHCPVGLLLNFHELRLADGIVRMRN